MIQLTWLLISICQSVIRGASRASLLGFALLWAILSSTAAAQNDRPAPPAVETKVFVSGEQGYHTYRIPSIIATTKGTLLAFCEARKAGRSDAGNIDLVLRRSTDGGKTWSKLQVIWDDEGHTCGNPCPVIDRSTGTVWLLLTWNHGKDQERQIKAGTSRQPRQVYISSSTDDGMTWAAPKNISATTRKADWRWYATGPGVGIQLTRGKYKGRMVIPCDHSGKYPDDPTGFASHAIYSDDHGKTWKLSDPIVPAANECQVAELIDGRLMMNMRNYKKSNPKQRAISFSADGGQHWSKMTYDPALIEPVCQASFLRYTWPEEHGRSRLLFANPASTSGRHKMTVRLSYDEGKTWPVSKMIYKDSSAYSCLTVLSDMNIGILYERDNYKSIHFASFSLDWLTNGKDKLAR